MIKFNAKKTHNAKLKMSELMFCFVSFLLYSLMFIDLLVWLCFISLQVSFQYQSCNNKYQLGNLVFDSLW